MVRPMKDSGVEWIGEIPEGWEVRTVGQLYKPRNEKVSDLDYEPLSVTKNGIVPQLESAAKSKNHNDRKLVLKGDFVINSRSDRKMSAGASPYDGSVSLINTVLYSGIVLSEYSKYLLKNYGFAEEFYRWGTGIVADLWSTNFERMKKIAIPLPMTEEQNKIASFLDQKITYIDSIIEKTEASIDAFKRYKQALIAETVTKGLNPDVPMKESIVEGIGMIPENWNFIKLKYLLSERKDKSTTGLEEPLSMSQKYGLIPSKEMDIIPNAPSNYLGNKIVSVGDLVFNKLKAHLGVFAVSNHEGIVSPDYAVYQTNNHVDAKFLEYLFKTPQLISEFIKKSRGVGAGLTRLYTPEFFNIKISLPPLKEQHQIVVFLDQKTAHIDSLIQNKEAMVVKLEEYKKSLIYEYVTGKKEVE